MRKIMVMAGLDIAAALPYIKENAREDPWLVLNNPDLLLHEYLTNLHDTFGLENSVLSRLKICRNLRWDKGHVCYRAASGRVFWPEDMVDLLRLLREAVLPQLTVQNRLLQTELMQQLVYLDYPLDRLRIALESEMRFREGPDLHGLQITLLQSLGAVANLPASPISVAVHSCLETCRGALGGVCAGPKLGLAAAKKSGKSTLVNCLLGSDISPASNETATPCSCEYAPSQDGHFHLWLGEQRHDCGSAAEVRKRMEAEFQRAQRSAEDGFSLPDMRVEYPGKNRLPGDWALVDTPGPNASGTTHRDSARNSLQGCDAAIFLVDYEKYLDDGEADYLAWIKSVYAARGSYHTLVFALNKMDLALKDNGAKSWVKSLDFIRSRLAAMDAGYSECLLFPLSALNYASLMTLASASEPAIRALLAEGAVWGEETRKSRRALRRTLDDHTLAAFTNLLASVESMEDILGLENPTTGEIRCLSGVPRLMNYVFGRIDLQSDWHQTARLLQDLGEARAQLAALLDSAAGPEKKNLSRACAPFLAAWQKMKF